MSAISGCRWLMNVLRTFHTFGDMNYDLGGYIAISGCWSTRRQNHSLCSMWTNVFYVFFHISKKHDFLGFFKWHFKQEAQLFIVSTTSRPLNKKSVCCQTANPVNNYYRKFGVRTPLCTCTAVGSLGTRLGAVAPNGTVPTRSRRNAITMYRYWDLGLRCVFCGAFCG